MVGVRRRTLRLFYSSLHPEIHANSHNGLIVPLFVLFLTYCFQEPREGRDPLLCAMQQKDFVYHSRFPSREIPLVPYTQFIFEKARSFGDKPALIDSVSGRRITYRQFINQSVNFALHLHHRGFRRGDVLAIISPNLPEYAVVFHVNYLVDFQYQFKLVAGGPPCRWYRDNH